MYKLPMFLYDKESVYRMDRTAVEADGLSEISSLFAAFDRLTSGLCRYC